MCYTPNKRKTPHYSSGYKYNKKEVNIMKKLRTRFNEIKEGFLTGKCDEAYPAYMYANALFILSIFSIFYIISVILLNIIQIAGICMITISILLKYIAKKVSLMISVKTL